MSIEPLAKDNYHRHYLHVILTSFQVSSYSRDYVDFDSDPFPGSVHDGHGTNVAGEIAMVRNNGICGVGVAYNAQIAGLNNCTEY